MLDTFAKRLNSQLVASPGDIDAGDRWAAGGHVRPTAWFAGAVLAGLGSLTASLPGTNTDPASTGWALSDRVRTQIVPYPGSVDIYARYAYAGHFLLQGGSTEVGGVLDTSLDALTGSFVGTASGVSAFDGLMPIALGSLTSALVGSSYYSLFIDIGYSVTPAFSFSDRAPSSGAMASTLGSLVGLAQGSALPPDSSSGVISSAFAGLSASFAGTMMAPVGRTGIVHGDLSALSTLMSGSVVPPQGNVGSIRASLGGLSAGFVGTFEVWSTDGIMTLGLGGLSTAFYGQFIPAGAIIGLIPGNLAPLSAGLRGVSITAHGARISARGTLRKITARAIASTTKASEGDI